MLDARQLGPGVCVMLLIPLAVAVVLWLLVQPVMGLLVLLVWSP